MTFGLFILSSFWHHCLVRAGIEQRPARKALTKCPMRACSTFWIKARAHSEAFHVQNSIITPRKPFSQSSCFPSVAIRLDLARRRHQVSEQRAQSIRARKEDNQGPAAAELVVASEICPKEQSTDSRTEAEKAKEVEVALRRVEAALRMAEHTLDDIPNLPSARMKKEVPVCCRSVSSKLRAQLNHIRTILRQFCQGITAR
jgi:hypothetical protein